MSCPACGRENRPGARFCLGCGTALAARCAACGADLPPDARFCDGCGASVAPESPDRAVAEQARKVVTVVFADLAGSTSVQERQDPESVRRMMDRFYAALRPEVEGRGGVVVKLTGDGLMAAFGVDTVGEDDAWRAVQAAAGLQAAFTDLSLPDPLTLRVGVNTGEVIVTAGDADVVGDAVNVAARLEAAAGPGQVLVGEETWRLTRQLATFELVAPLELRGKRQLVPAYRLVAVADPGGDGSAPFVGRETELSRLTALFDDVVEQRTARLATVVGSPGLGKSRLAAQLVSTLGDRAITLEARFSATAASTFGPLLDALRAAVGETAVGDIVSGSPQTAFLAVRRAIEALAAARPVVLVLEDLHWAEPLLLDLVEHLVEWTRAAPLLLVALARPELREIRPALVETGGRATLVTVLEGLDPAETERLACDLLETDDLPPALVRRVLVGSEGNPLFVRELVRMLVDDGVLRRHGEGWRSTIEVDAITVPPTIQSLMAARVERLPVDERTVLECAAVVGREFYRGAVAELLPPHLRAQLGTVLERLRQKEMVEPEGTYWIDEPVLRFHHVLLRDAAYRRLLKEVRADLHERYARWLEAKAGIGGEADDEILGYHLEHAHQYRAELGVFDDRTALLGREAATRLAAAGRRALDRDDLPAAAGLLGRALARADGTDPERPGLLIDRCEALIATGALADGADALAELQELATGSPRLRAWAGCFSAQLTSLTDPEHLVEAASAVQDAAAQLSKLADAAGAAKAHAVHAAVLARLGHVGDCEVALDRALAAAREAGDTRRATAVLAGAPLAALWGPSPIARASGRCLDVVRVLRITTSATTVEATSLRCQAVLESLRGRTDAARRMLASARSSLEELGHRHGLLSTEMFAGLVELFADDPVAAERELRAAHDGFVELGVGADAGQAAALLGRALLAQGRVEEAEALTVESERLGGADMKTAIAWRAVRAEALARRGAVDEALALARAAVALAEPTDALLDQADTHLALATVLQLAGRNEEGATEATRAAELYERKGATVLAQRAALLVGPKRGTAPAAPAAARRVRRIPETAMTRWWERARASLARGDQTAYRALFSADLVVVDHIHQLDRPPREDVEPRVEPLAAIGDRHGLVRTHRRMDDQLAGASEVEDLRVQRIDERGLLVRSERYAADELHLALARVIELYAEEEAPSTRRKPLARTAEIVRRLDSALGGNGDMMAEDVIVVDRRPAGLGTLRGRQTMVEVSAGLVGLVRDTRRRMVDVLALVAERDREIGLIETVVEGHSGDGTDFALRMLALNIVGPDGTIERAEWFAPEQADEALARFDELTAAGSHVAPPTNKVLAVVERGFEMFRRGETPDPADFYSPTARIEDRRRGLRSAVTGQAARTNYELVASHVEELHSEPIATRGDRLALVRTRMHGGAATPFDAEVIQLYECDDDGRLVLNIAFDGDDLRIAVAEMAERYAVGEGAGQREVCATTEAFFDALAAQNAGALQPLISRAFVAVDHRGAGWGTVSREEYVQLMTSLWDMSSDYTVLPAAVLAVNGRGAVYLAESPGTSTSGGTYEITWCPVMLVEDGLVTRYEVYPGDAQQAAVARFDELTRAVEHGVLENACTRVFEAFDRFFFARDWEGMTTIVAPEIRQEDRRTGFKLVRVGAAAHVEASRQLAELGTTRIDRAIIAVRGEHLALSRNVLSGVSEDGDRIEVDTLLIRELDDVGRFSGTCAFDPDDLDAAFAELDRRFAASLPAPLQRTWAVGTGFLEAYNTRAWDALAGLLHPDFIALDRRPAGFGELDAQGFVDWARSLVSMAPDIRLSAADVPFLGEDGLAARVLSRGSVSGGGEFELDRVTRVAVRDGKLLRLEFFPLEDLEVAVRGQEPNAAALAPVLLENEETRTLERYEAARKAGDEAAVLATISEQIVMDDRRAGTRNLVQGQDAVIAHVRALGARIARTMECIATRGDHLALYRASYRGVAEESGPIEVDTLEMGEVDADGREILTVTFDAHDLDAAYAELDARYLAGEGAPCGDVHELMMRSFAAWSARDWTTFDSFAPGAVVHDRRPLGHGEISATEFVARTRGLAELLPDGEVRIREVVALAPGRWLGLLHGSGHGPDGGVAEYEFFVVAVVANGAVSRAEFVAGDDRASALRRFEELDGGPTPWTIPPNRAHENGLVMAARVLAHDEAGAAALHSPAFVFEDRRSGTLDAPPVGVGRQVRSVAGVEAVPMTLVATRGERLALERVVWEGAVPDGGGPFEVEMLVLGELDEDGLIARRVLFDADDLDAAFEELDSRYVLGEGAACRGLFERAMAGFHAWNARAWDVLAANMAADAVMVDRRPAGWGQLTRAGFVEHVRTLPDLVVDGRIRVVEVPRLGQRTWLGHIEGRGHASDGGPVAYTFWVVAVVEHDRVARIEFLPIEDRTAAVARFDTLAGRLGTFRPNRAHELGVRLAERLVAGDFEAIAALHADDYVEEDHRSGTIDFELDPADRAKTLRTVEALEVEPVATRGERLALDRLTWRGHGPGGGGEFEAETLVLGELDDDGRVCRRTHFDADAPDAAYEELDRRFAAGEARPFTNTVTFLSETNVLWARRDWARLATYYREDVEVVDSRPLGWGTITGADFLERSKALVEAAPDISVRSIAVPRIGHWGAISVLQFTGTSAEGADVELVFGGHWTLEDSRLTRVEWFPVERLSQVIARFDAQVRSRDVVPPNECRRAREAYLRAFASRDRDRLVEMIAADATVNDHRPLMLGTGRRGKEEVLNGIEALFSIGVTNQRHEVLATRGERLELTRVTVSGPTGAGDGAEFTGLFLLEIDDAGRLIHNGAFDLNQLDEAYADLDRRFREHESAPFADTLRLVEASSRAFTARDWAGFERALAPGLEVVEHGDVGFRRRGRDQYVASTRALTDLAPDVGATCVAVPQVSERGAVSIWRFAGTYGDAGPFERTSVLVTIVRGNVITRIETFDGADLDSAVARFDELTRQNSAVPPNRAADVGGEIEARLLAGDTEGFAALFAPGAVTDDRRAGLRSTVSGPELLRVLAASLVGVTAVTPTLVATRGQRLAQVHVLFRGEDAHGGAFEAEIVEIIDIDEAGLVTAIVVFDDDLEAAFAELDRRFAEGEAAQHPEAWARTQQVLEILNAQDSTGLTEIVAPSFRVVDHRPVGWGELDAEGFLALTRLRAELAPAATIQYTAVPRLSDTAAAGSVRMAGRTVEGADFEIAFATVATIRAGLVDQVELFAAEDLDLAIARFEDLERSAAAPDATNASVQAGTRFIDLWLAREWDEVAALFEPGGFVEERRRGWRTASTGRSDIAAFFRQTSGVEAASVRIIATRGNRLSLGTTVSSGTTAATGTFEVETVQIVETGPAGLITAMITFDPIDLDAALEELDERYLRDEGASHAFEWRVGNAFFAAYAARDWSALAVTMTPDLKVLDHRTMGWPARSRDQYLETIRALAAQVNDDRMFVSEILRASPAGDVSRFVHRGTDTAGVVFERRFLALTLIDGSGRAKLFEYWEDYDVNAALARFDEVVLSAEPVYVNRAMQIGGELNRLLLAGDWDGVATLYSPDLRLDDRRPGLRSTFVGAEAVAAVTRGLAAVTGIAHNYVATRGDRLHLANLRFSGTDRQGVEFEVDTLQVLEIDDDGEPSAVVTFEPADHEAAFEELDGRFAAGEAAGCPTPWRTIRDVVAAFNSGDPDRFAATALGLASAIDHRNLGWGRTSGAGFAESSKTSVGGDARMRCTAVPRIRPDAIVAVLETTGIVPMGGGPWEQAFAVVAWLEGSRTDQLEFFDIEHLDDAVRRFDESVEPRGDPPIKDLVPPNRAAEVIAGIVRASVAQDWETVERCFNPACTTTDLRPLFRTRIEGAGNVISNLRSIVGTGGTTRITSSVVATRGERHAVRMLRFHGGSLAHDRFEVQTLQASELDEQGLVLRTFVYEPDDLARAVEQMHARYLAGEGQATADALEVGDAFAAAYERRDWEAYEALLTEDVAVIDHRSMAFPPRDRASFLASTGALTASVDHDRMIRLSTPRLSAHGAVAVVLQTGVYGDGVPFERIMVLIGMIRDGRFSRLEYFDASQLDAALARFEELASGDVVRPSANSAVETSRRLIDLTIAVDVDAVAATYAPAAVIDDRRAGLASVVTGPEAMRMSAQAMADVTSADITTLATRGDRLTLGSVLWRGDDRFEIETVHVLEVDDRSLIVGNVVFDPDDLDAAYAELDRRYLEGEGAEYERVLQRGAAFLDAYGSRDWAAAADTVVHDVQVADHRLAGWPGRDKDAYVASSQALVEQMADEQVRCVAIPRISARGAVRVIDQRGTYGDDVAFERSFVVLVAKDGDGNEHIEYFDAGDLGAAIARFESLTS
ncbi:MAG: hypothetical protein QOE35_1552 [Actinomycetota bacterium]|jgi:class 3 adenylate cyclase/ketosteroid isomerase-like protein/tetratricopeptide (TPR) repeat protein